MYGRAWTMCFRRGRSTPAMRAMVLRYLSALPLLVARVVADDAKDAAALHDLALVADFLDAGSHLHGLPLELPDDLSAVRIVLRELNEDLVTWKEPHDCVPQFGSCPCADRSTRFEPDAEQSVGQCFLDDSFAGVVFRSLSPVSWFGSSVLAERGQDPPRDLRRLAHSVDSLEQAELLIVREQRGGHRVVGIQTLLDRLLPIVGPMFELGVRGGRVILQVVDLSRAFVGAAQGGALHQKLASDIDLDNAVERGAQALEQGGKRLGLGNRPRKSVQDETRLGVGLSQPLFHQANHDRVGDQAARAHELLGFLAEGGTCFEGGAQHVARRDLRDPEARAELVGLRALAACRRTQENDPHAGLRPLRRATPGPVMVS